MALRGCRPIFVPVAVVLWLSACGKADVVQTDAPAELTHAVVLSYDQDGNFLRSGPLVPWSAESPVNLAVAPDTRVWILGYDVPTLERAGLLADANANIFESGFTLAQGCEPTFPTPVWAGVRSDGQFATQPPADAPSLTSPVLLGRCPESRIDVRCGEARAQFSACEAALDLGDVGSGAAHVGLDGSVCFEVPRTCSETSRPTTAAALSCGIGCDIDVYIQPSPPVLDIERVGVIETAQPYLPSEDSAAARFRPPGMRVGYAFDVAMTDDSVAVIVASAGMPELGCPDGPKFATELRFFDTRTLQQTRTATLAPCASVLTGAVDGPGLYSSASPDSHWHLYRHDGAGRVVVDVTTTVRADVFGEPRESTDVTAMVDSGRWLAVLYDTRIGPGGHATLEVRDRDTLALQRTVMLPKAFVMDATSETQVAVGMSDRAVRLVDLNTGDVSALRDGSVFGTSFSLLRVPRTQQMILGTDAADIVEIIDSAGTVQAAGWFEEGHVLTSVAPWTGPERFLAALLLKEGWKASLTILDTTFGRLAPSSVQVGHGPPGPAVVDDQGNVFLLMRWTGELLRIAPAR